MRPPSIRARPPFDNHVQPVQQPFAPALGWFVLWGRLRIAGDQSLVASCRRTGSSSSHATNPNLRARGCTVPLFQARHGAGSITARLVKGKHFAKGVIAPPMQPRPFATDITTAQAGYQHQARLRVTQLGHPRYQRLRATSRPKRKGPIDQLWALGVRSGLARMRPSTSDTIAAPSHRHPRDQHIGLFAGVFSSGAFRGR